MILDKSIIIPALQDYLFIVIFCLIGATVKDTYNTFIEKDTRVNIVRIIISTMISSIIIFSLSDYLIDRISWKLLILPCFVGGVIGFELMEKINNVDLWIKFMGGNKINFKKDDKEDGQ